LLLRASPGGVATAGASYSRIAPYPRRISRCSRNAVAGSTTSAQRQVSVNTCSCTTVNRSSRASPRSTRF
jgi:hypothetical protein